MLLSIIIPVYNVEAYVGRSLDSVFNTSASENEFEVIVVNDGTQDDSMTIVRRYADRPNLTILEQENQGLSLARMNGLAMAKGDYVWFVDSDDWLVEDGVGTALRLLKERKDAEVLMFPIKRTGSLQFRDDPPFIDDNTLEVEGKVAMRDLKVPTCPCFRFIVKKSLTENQWLFFPAGLIHEDEYFGPVLLTLTAKLVIIPTVLYVHLIRPGSIMTSLTTRTSYDLVSIYRLLIKYMDNALDASDRSWFREYCFGRLMESYNRCPQFHGTPAFNRFVRKNGLFVWREWMSANPDKSILKKARKLFFFMMPKTRSLLIASR